MSVCLSCGMVPVACVYENDDSEEAYGCLLRYGALRTALTASQQRVKELEGERDDLKAAWNTSAAAHWMHRAGDAEQRLRAWPLALAQHWLDGITCDEEQGRDNPRCSCAEEFLGWYPSVGDAVKGWVDHVERSLPAYARPPSQTSNSA